MRTIRRGVAIATLLTGALVVVPAGPAAADEIGAGTAGAYGATVSLAGNALVPPTPEVEVVAPPGDNVQETTIDIPADPLAVSGTLTASARVHGPSDIPSSLQVNTQEVAGPYNAQGMALIEGLDVLLDVPTGGVSLVSADAVRAEAVAVCSAGGVQYSANSEIVNLDIAGEDVPLNGPIEDILDAVGDLLEQSGLNQVVDVQRNVVTESANGIAVDALVVTVLAAAGTPVVEARIGHAEASAVSCGNMPECSDGADNDGDGHIDHPADPQCTSPQDDSEAPECSNGRDDDGDGAIDFPADPGCTDANDDSEADAPECSDGRDNDGDGRIDHPADPGCTDVNDDSENSDGSGVQNTGGQRGSLARTGGESGMTAAAALALAGLAGLALRRRLTSV